MTSLLYILQFLHGYRRMVRRTLVGVVAPEWVPHNTHQSKYIEHGWPRANVGGTDLSE